MKNKQKNTRIKNIILVIFVIALSFSLFYLFERFNNEIDSDKINNNSNDDVIITLNNAEYYQLEDLDINFVVADVTLKSDKPVIFNLNNIKTNQNIILGNYQDLIDKMSFNGYFLATKGISFNDIELNDVEYRTKLLIPLKQKEDLVVLKYNDQNIEININNLMVRNGEDLRRIDEDSVIDGNLYEITLSNIYNVSSEIIEYNQNEYNVPNAMSVYAIGLNIKPLSNINTKIISAKLVIGNDIFTAFDENYFVSNYTNAFGVSSVNERINYLFFEVFVSNEHEGKLYIKTNIDSNEIVLDIKLNEVSL